MSEAFLYLASPREWTAGEARAESLGLLSSAERRRHARFRVEPPADAFLTGRALVRRALALHGEAEATEWEIEPDEHGRPRIVGPTPAPDFNLSHNAETVVCLISGGRPGGVDIEALDREVDELRIADHSFGEDEVEELARLRGDARRDLFYAYWTLKEAYLKARGRGIAMRLDSVVFRLVDGGEGRRIEARFAERTGDRPSDWRFVLFALENRQRLAVAAAGGEELALRSFRARPENLRAEELELEPIAATP